MVAIIWGGDNGSFFVPFGVLTFWRPFARFLFYRKHFLLVRKRHPKGIPTVSHFFVLHLDVNLKKLCKTSVYFFCLQQIGKISFKSGKLQFLKYGILLIEMSCAFGGLFMESDVYHICLKNVYRACK